MLKNIFTLAAAAAIISISAEAQDMQRFQRRGDGQRMRRNMFNSRESNENWASIQQQLKKKNPQKYAEIQKLAETNLQAAMQQMRDLARQENLTGTQRRFERPQAGGGSRMNFAEIEQKRKEAFEQIKKTVPAEYAKITAAEKRIEDLKKSSADAQIALEREIASAGKKARVSVPDTMATYIAKIKYLSEKYPQETEKIKKAANSNNGTNSAAEEWKKLAEKEGLTLNFTMSSGRNNFRSNMQQQTQQKTSARKDGMEKIKELRKKYPEEMKKFDELRKTNPKESRLLLQQLMRKDEKK